MLDMLGELFIEPSMSPRQMVQVEKGGRIVKIGKRLTRWRWLGRNCAKTGDTLN